MPHLHSITAQEFVDSAAAVGVDIPIEQDPLWDQYESRAQGKTRRSTFLSWGNEALVSVRDYPLHGKDILWARSGPIWLVPWSEELERDLVQDLRDYARATTKAIALRLHTQVPHQGALPTFHEVAYDTTVFVDLDKSEDEVLADMRKRGRRDVRKAMRSEIQVTEISPTQIVGRLDALYAVMNATAARDSFAALPQERMRAFLETLVPAGKVRLFEAARGDHLVAWAIIVVTGDHAQYYFGASDSTDREGAADLVIWEALKATRKDGVKVFDMMGIGSDLAPALSSLTMFKTKFAAEPTTVAPARDYPLSRKYKLLCMERSVSHAMTDLISHLRGPRD